MHNQINVCPFKRKMLFCLPPIVCSAPVTGLHITWKNMVLLWTISRLSPGFPTHVSLHIHSLSCFVNFLDSVSDEKKCWNRQILVVQPNKGVVLAPTQVGQPSSIYNRNRVEHKATGATVVKKKTGARDPVGLLRGQAWVSIACISLAVWLQPNCKGG
jgi:hypothetical protein